MAFPALERISRKRPTKWPWRLVSLGHERFRPLAKMDGTGMAGVAQDTPRINAEEQFDLVHPTGVKWGEVKMKAVAMTGVKIVPDRFRRMRIEIVPDDVDRLFGVNLGDHLHEFHQVGLRPPITASADHTAGVNVESGDQSLCAVPNVLEFPSPKSAGLRRTVEMLSFDRLNAGLFVDRQNHGTFRHLMIQRTDRIHFFAKRGVGAVQPLANAMGSDVARLENAMQVTAADRVHHLAADRLVEQFVQCRRRPTILFRRGASQGEQFHASVMLNPFRSARSCRFLQSLLATASNTSAPEADRRHRNFKLTGNRCRRHPIGRHQRYTGAQNLALWRSRPAQRCFQRLPLRIRKHYLLRKPSSSHTKRMTQII
jgi:hypothetical protein